MNLLCVFWGLASVASTGVATSSGEELSLRNKLMNQIDPAQSGSGGFSSHVMPGDFSSHVMPEDFSSHVMPQEFEDAGFTTNVPKLTPNPVKEAFSTQAVSVEKFGLIGDGAGFVYDNVIKPIGKNAKKNLGRAIQGIRNGAEDAWEALEDGWDSVVDYIENDFLDDVVEIAKMIAEKLCEGPTDIGPIQVDFGDFLDTLCGKAVKAIVCIVTAGLVPGCEKPVDESDLSKYEKLRKLAKEKARKTAIDTVLDEIEISVECAIMTALDATPGIKEVCEGGKVFIANTAARSSRETLQNKGQPPYATACSIARKCTLCKITGYDCKCDQKSRCKGPNFLKEKAKKVAQIVDASAKELVRAVPKHLMYSTTLGGYVRLRGTKLVIEANTASRVSFIELETPNTFAIKIDNGGYLSARQNTVELVKQFSGASETWALLPSTTQNGHFKIHNAMNNYRSFLTAKGFQLSITSVPDGTESFGLAVDESAQVSCTDGRAGCCSPGQQCGQGQGGCSSDNDCIGGLQCGRGNCKQEFGFGTVNSNCCTVSSRVQCNKSNKGNTTACCKAGQCEVGEGGCTEDYQCKGHLVCGKNNCQRQFGW
eukprot:CAMPEP_0203757968 /NCGR_PEP_ID=MMETSP0098-20131031/10782_1 /ASSEMBLY_ACC=CAM_ASM_000208 /TAXON_ID=96639 /ORGANISM=" , Strain NY0313808BC1" /LENGTH=594 /DNA_ID=CAMNT_0050650213 /DNA_START=79 /DNA_END=1860 /DNA_ORIENTATION=-